VVLAHPDRVEAQSLGEPRELDHVPVFLREGSFRALRYLSGEQAETDADAHAPTLAAALLAPRRAALSPSFADPTGRCATGEDRTTEVIVEP
jgi:hypothetical protein